MAASLCRQIPSGMLGFCFYSQLVLWLTLEPRPSNAHSYPRWKHTTILKMVIISIKCIITIMSVDHNIVGQAGWILSVPGSCTSSTTRNLFSMSSPLRVSWGSCQQFLSVTPEPFRTACAIVLRERLATAARVPGTDAGCGLSIRGLWAGLAICNERQRVWKHTTTRSVYYYINYGYYNTISFGLK